MNARTSLFLLCRFPCRSLCRSRRITRLTRSSPTRVADKGNDKGFRRSVFSAISLAAFLLAGCDIVSPPEPAPPPRKPPEVPVSMPLPRSDHRDMALGQPVTPEELAAWWDTVKDHTPKRCTMARLPNGGWTMRLPDGTPFLAVGVEYEPLSMYGEMKWELVIRDMDLIKECGFNTVAVWCMDFHAGWGNGVRMTIPEMVRLAELARERELYIQFYLNSDRFVHLFPHAVTSEGKTHHFDIDFCDPQYRAFMRNFAARLAMAFYTLDNVSTIAVWEEKVGISMDRVDDHFRVTALFGSDAGKRAFADWLRVRHGAIDTLNTRWGTAYASFAQAGSDTLRDYFAGVPGDDHRQFDLLEFSQVMLIDYTRDFVDAYKAVDSSMLFQCRSFDLFGPVHPLHPDYAFLDSFGINNYSLGHRGYDISYREEIVKTKLVSGIAKTAPYVSNFGYRSRTDDGGTHGLVPNEQVKAAMACDASALFSYLPEISGTSYFIYYFEGKEGYWGIIEDQYGAKRLPIFHALKALHELFTLKNETIARADYARKADFHVFHGLDAVYDLRQTAWIEHTTMSFDLTEMNLNYEVITDVDDLDPGDQPVILANFHAYDKHLDTDTAARLLEYCREGGTLIIGNAFAQNDRYMWPNRSLEGALREMKGLETGELKRGRVRVKGKGQVDLLIDDTYYVEARTPVDKNSSEVLLAMEVGGKRHPGLIRRRYGKGTVYYFLFNPWRQALWGHDLQKENRTSLPLLHFLCQELGLEHDVEFGNRGFALEHGRSNLHQQPVHHCVSKDVAGIGTYEDEYGENREVYSGGVITRDFISFRGRRLRERGWKVQASDVTSIYAATEGDGLVYFTLDPVDLGIAKGDLKARQPTEPYRVYRVTAP